MVDETVPWSYHGTVMQWALSLFLFICFGLMASAGAQPLRLCLLKWEILSIEQCMAFSTTQQHKACCDHQQDAGENCTPQHQPGSPADECCVNLDKVPDSTAPAMPERVPAMVAFELPRFVYGDLVPLNIEQRDTDIHTLPVNFRDRGPSSRRAMLNIWRI